MKVFAKAARFTHKYASAVSTVAICAVLFSAPFFIEFPADATLFDGTNQATTFANIPVCNAARDMSKVAITDGTSTTVGQTVTVGGGTSHDLLICNGSAATPVWTVFAGVSGAGASPTVQNVAMAAPTTTLGNYGTATNCTGTPFINDGQHNCLTFDDHWTAASLDAGPTGHWFEGNSQCNNQGAQNCGTDPGGDNVGAFFYHYPFTGWCNLGPGAINGCQNVGFYDYPYGYASNISNTGNMLSQAADGSLDLRAIKSTFLNGNATYCNLSDTYCNAGNLDWLSAAMTSGGMTTPTNNREQYPANVAQASATIPYTGGMIQWRMKLDDSVSYGAYPILECDPYGASFSQKGNAVGGPNANFEFGYTNAGNDLTGHYYGTSIGNTANTTLTVTTGDISTNGVTASATSGDVRNWHKYGMEWTGTAWNYYVDNVRTTGPSTPVSAPAGANGFTCSFSLGVSYTGSWTSFRTVPDGVHNGPFHMYISDIQFYKKPGT